MYVPDMFASNAVQLRNGNQLAIVLPHIRGEVCFYLPNPVLSKYRGIVAFASKQGPVSSTIGLIGYGGVPPKIG